MKKLIVFLLSLCFLVVDCFGAYYMYKLYKDKKKAEPATASAVAYNAEPEQKNPYEDPNDPNTTEKGTVFNVGGEPTGYFMELRMADLRAEASRVAGFQNNTEPSREYVHDLTKVWKKKTSEVTALVTFVNIEYNGRPVHVSVNTNITADRVAFKKGWKFTFRNNFLEEDNTALRLPAAYYNFLKLEQEKGEYLGKVSFILTWDGNKAQGVSGTYEIPVRLYIKDVPADIDDPQSPNFDLGTWAGLMSVVKEKTGCDGCTGFSMKTMLYIVIALIVLAVVVFIGRLLTK